MRIKYQINSKTIIKNKLWIKKKALAKETKFKNRL